jgi:hypothetical protein
MADLKLGRLPDRTPVKLTITVPPDLAEALTSYASLYREIYTSTMSPWQSSCLPCCAPFWKAIAALQKPVRHRSPNSVFRGTTRS